MYAGQYKLEVEAKYEAGGEDTLSSKQELELELEFEVQRLFANYQAFALVKIDRTVENWGNASFGGAPADVTGLTNVKEIFSTPGAFAALKNIKFFWRIMLCI